MEQIILLAIQAVEALLPAIGQLAPASASKVILLLENAIPAAVTLGQDLVTPIQNIIAQLEGSGAVTADQIAALRAQMTQDEADLDAAAKDDGLTS